MNEYKYIRRYTSHKVKQIVCTAIAEKDKTTAYIWLISELTRLEDAITFSFPGAGRPLIRIRIETYPYTINDLRNLNVWNLFMFPYTVELFY